MVLLFSHFFAKLLKKVEIFSKLRKKKSTEESIFFDRVKLLSHERNFVLLVRKKILPWKWCTPPLKKYFSSTVWNSKWYFVLLEFCSMREIISTLENSRWNKNSLPCYVFALNLHFFRTSKLLVRTLEYHRTMRIAAQQIDQSRVWIR